MAEEVWVPASMYGAVARESASDVEVVAPFRERRPPRRRGPPAGLIVVSTLVFVLVGALLFVAGHRERKAAALGGGPHGGAFRTSLFGRMPKHHLDTSTDTPSLVYEVTNR